MFAEKERLEYRVISLNLAVKTSILLRHCSKSSAFRLAILPW